MENHEEMALLESLNVGKPVQDAMNIDIPGSAGCFEWYAEAIDKLYGEVAPTDGNNVATITREPVSVSLRRLCRGIFRWILLPGNWHRH